MDEAKQRLIASMGGKRAHELGRGHRWTSEEARLAGAKGGREAHRRRREKQRIEAATAEPVETVNYYA